MDKIQQLIDKMTPNKTTVGFSDADHEAEKNKKREIGEIWSIQDKHGNTKWLEQKQGYKIIHALHPDTLKSLYEARNLLTNFRNCPHEKCLCVKPTHLDKKAQICNGMCFDCQVKMETKLKAEGKFEEYEKNKIKQNSLSWLKDAEDDIQILKNTITSNVEFVNEEGGIDKWSTLSSDYVKEIDSEFDKFKQKFMEESDI